MYLRKYNFYIDMQLILLTLISYGSCSEIDISHCVFTGLERKYNYGGILTDLINQNTATASNCRHYISYFVKVDLFYV